MTIRTLIVDDEALARRLLKDYVSKTPGLSLVATCEDALAAREVLQREEVDLMFLDIEMPELSGLDFLKSLKNPPLTVLTTAYEQYALKGYELEVIDYLLKPIPFDRFLSAVSKAQEYLKLKRAAPLAADPPAGKDYFFLKVDYQIRKVRFADILFIEGLREYIRIHTTEKRLVIRQTMSRMEEVLPAEQFVRIHRSYLVNLDRLDSVTGNMVHIQEHELPISKGYKEEFLTRINREQLF